MAIKRKKTEEEEEIERREEEAEKRKEEAKKAGDEARSKADDIFGGPQGAPKWGDREDGGKMRGATIAGDFPTEQIVQIQTPSGGFVSARSSDLRVLDNVEDADYARKLDKERAQERQDKVANYRRERAMNRLTDSGYDWKSEDSAALFNPDGTLNTSKAKMAADRAEGLKAQRTFETWDEEKRMLATGKEQQKMDRQRLRLVNQALREGRGDAAALQAEKLGLQNSTQYMDDRDFTEFGKRREQTALADIERAKAIQNSQKNQADALLQRAEAANFALSDEQLKTFGLPALTDEEGWQKAIAENPFLQQFYNSLKLPKVSKTGQAMSKALSAYV